MAIVSFEKADGSALMRGFPAPKRAGELKYWWRAARKVMPSMPEWQDGFANHAYVTYETIIIGRGNSGISWLLIIYRKRNLIG